MKNAFTIIELIIVIGILSVILAVSIPIYGNLQITAQLDENNTQLAQIIRIARQRSISRYNNSSHGVKFQADRYTLYQGSSFASRQSAYDREVVLNNALTLSSSIVNDDVNFSKGFGIPNNVGTTTLTHDGGGARYININSMGMVEEN